MKSLEYINLLSLTDTLVSLTAAFILGGLIGIERQIRQRTAGLRTNVLVCTGAALFVDVGVSYYTLHGGNTSPVHVIAYVVSGVGFLGAGVIMREGGSVRGINTAATLWGSAAVGCAAGADLLLEAIVGALFVLAANTLLRPAVNRINRQPIDTQDMEATYIIYAIAERERRKEALHLIESTFDTAGIPLRDIEVRAFGEQEIEIEAALLPTSIGGNELDPLLAKLRRNSGIRQAFWSASTTE
ncbi:MAG: MgtC/SapB family protein [Corticimicrobacter sp.]|uniref:MgtC/SapB family protein n=1 Tax=Corticimicrobacter sp. TaxID=2678536 RepID=UPI0032DB2670